MTKKLIIATFAALSFSASSALAQVAAPQVSVQAQAQSIAIANSANSAVAGVLTAAEALSQAEINKLAQVLDGSTRVKRTTRKLTQNIDNLKKLSQKGKIGTAEVSAIKDLNAKLIKALVTIDAEDMTNYLDILNGELGRAIDATAGNAAELETKVIIDNLTKISENATDLDEKVREVLKVSVQELKDACPVKQAS